MNKVLKALPPLIFLALAVTFYLGMKRDNPGDLPSALLGQNAPDLPQIAVSGTASLGTSVSEGEVTLVNFWASWCPPCRAEHPQLLLLADDGVRIVGVNFNDRDEDASAYLKRDGNPFAATAVDPSGRASLEWGVIAPPETFIVAADGTILHRHIGPLVGSHYDLSFVPALTEALK